MKEFQFTFRGVDDQFFNAHFDFSFSVKADTYPEAFNSAWLYFTDNISLPCRFVQSIDIKEV